MRCHVGFDQPGLREALRRGHVVVLVDVLSFSTAVAAGAARGVDFFPAGSGRRAQALAAAPGAGVVASVSRKDPPGPGRYSLSPLSFAEAPAGLTVALRSPNGARLAVAARGAPALLVAGLVNATAVGRAATEEARRLGRGVTVLACGERAAGSHGRRRFAVEDFLGAGAVAAAVGLPRTGEAEVAVRAFEAVRGHLEAVLLGSESGADLVRAGFAEDVRFAARVDSIAAVPEFSGGCIRRRP